MRGTVDDWLTLSAARVHAQAGLLTRLDQAIGDGDHGINLDRGFSAVAAVVADTSPTSSGAPAADQPAAAADRLRQAGRTLISTVGGASGPLYGTALLRAAAAIRSGAGPGVAPGTLLVLGLEAAAEGIGALGRSTAGEKTMLDALLPAADAARAALQNGEDLSAIARAAAEEAEAGAERTVAMLATKGRASYLGERSVGHRDPGATSTALLLRALADTLAA